MHHFDMGSIVVEYFKEKPMEHDGIIKSPFGQGTIETRGEGDDTTDSSSMQITSFFISKVISPRSIWHWCKNWSHDWSDVIFYFFFTGTLASQNNRCYLPEETVLELIQKYLNVLVYWNRDGDPLPFWSLLDSAWGSRLSILALNVPVSICMHLFISKLLFVSMSCYQPIHMSSLLERITVLRAEEPIAEIWVAVYAGCAQLRWYCQDFLFYKKVALFLFLSEWDSNTDEDIELLRLNNYQKVAKKYQTKYLT